jgi:hypothetical protein
MSELLAKEGSKIRKISPYRHGLVEVFALMGFYSLFAVFSYQRLIWTAWSLKVGPIGCPEMSVNNYQGRCVTSQKSEGL